MTGRRTRVPGAWSHVVARLLLPFLVAALSAPGTVAAQSASVSGRVLLGSRTGERPVAGQRVVLHRIDSDSAGPIDSVRSSPTGQYRFRYRPAGDSAMYIASTRYAGVAYFTSPLTAGNAAGDSADIVVYDTAAAPFPLAVRGRHLVIASPAAGGGRRVVDVFEIANDSAVTRVAGDSPHGTWSIRLPDGAQSPAVGQGDISPEAVRFANGGATLFAPVAPGLKQVVLTYLLPAGAEQVSVPVDQATSVFEVLLEDASARASGGGLVRQPSVSMQGRTFERFIGQDVPASATLQLSLAAGAGGIAGAFTSPSGRVLLVALAGGLLALGVVVGRRRMAPVPVGTAAASAVPSAVDPQGVEALANAIAALDAAFEGQASPTDAARHAYERRRAELKARLVALLAASADAQ